VIHHAALVEDWVAAKKVGRYEVSTRGATLTAVGFIHASYEHQLAGVANRFYADVDELVVLSIDPDAVGAQVVDEADSTGERFPHIYGPLPVDAVLDATLWQRHEGGLWQRGRESRPDR
jgi:uncharacterized protein (DUF952 family)